MTSFEEHFSDDRILHYVYKCRARLAKRRNRQHLIYNLSGNNKTLLRTRIRLDDEDEVLLQKILPPRRKWKKLNQWARTKPTGQPLNTLDKTVRILKRTVRWYQEKKPTAPFLDELTQFCDTVRSYATTPTPVLPCPKILPVLKEQGGTVCRPIAVYPLAAKIAICITNRYLSERFDAYFEPCSFAFRMPRNSCGHGAKPTHHDAFAQIIEARRRRKRCDYWVAECDIQKFFDTVNHSVLKRVFRSLVARVNRDNPQYPVSEAAVRIFLAYLESYSFNKLVWPKNDPKLRFFDEHHLSGCHFGWVDKELVQQRLYRSFGNAKIGVPQGGALSGLIANILLDQVDKLLMKHDDGRLVYVRYCDDMVVMHPRKKKCRECMEQYNDGLRKLKLLPHTPEDTGAYGQSFWTTKSKRPYKWGPRGSVPWVGFVGYEVNIHGDVRVRKSSLKKEMQKQFNTVQEVMDSFKGQPRVSHKTIRESVTGRLIQMSVGNVSLHNYQTAESEMCWVDGFRLVTDNKYSRIQMKRLDACRNSLLWRFRKRLERDVEETDSSTGSRHRQIVYSGKPFSYYYHAIEKPRHTPDDSH